MKIRYFLAAALLLVLGTCARPATAQRVLGLDVSTYQGNITQTQWNNIRVDDNRQFVFIRSSRGGTTGEDHRQGGYPAGNNTYFNLSERYDDPYFVQNINRATTAGLLAGSYHFARLDVIESTENSGGIANSGADEANHFIQMAGAWMRPGYLPPVFDLESGQSQRTAEQIAQFSLDFSNRIYDAMGIRPAMYINGSYSSTLQGASTLLREQLARPLGLQPSVVTPGYPTLWNARFATGANVQVDNPKDTAATFYGPWDDYGVAQPWNFWQYSSSGSLQGISPLDQDVSHGDIEYLKDSLVPAVWTNDSSGDWTTLLNWNSGQTPVAPVSSPGQLTPFATGPLPTPRLPGAAGTSVTDGQNDTVILERPNANITVTISSGTHNVRKLYVREALNVTGGSLTVNYDPTYAVPLNGGGNPLYPNALRSGPISAQFSGPVTLSGSGALNVHVLQVDAAQTFTHSGGTLAFDRINLMPHGTSPATMAMNVDLDVNPPAGVTATIANGAGAGLSGRLNLGGANRTFNVGNGSANVDFSVSAQVVNGGLNKIGAGTMRLAGPNTYSGGTTVGTGRLLVSNTSGDSGTGTGDVLLSSGTTLGGTGTITGNVVLNGATLAPGESIGTLSAANVSFNAASAFDYEYNSNLLTADLLNTAGGLNIDSNVGLSLTNLFSGQVPRDTKLTLISYDGGWNGGLFTGYANNSHFSYGGNEFDLRYDDTPAGSTNGGEYAHAVTLKATTGPFSTTIEGFREFYDPINWTTDASNAPGGFVDTSGAPGSIKIVGPDSPTVVVNTKIDFLIQVPASGMFTFDWLYTSLDDPTYDAGYYINNQEFFLSEFNGQSGHVSVAVSAGDIIGWRVRSDDSILRPGMLTISNFSAPALAPVPEPSSAVLFAAAIGLCNVALAARRRGRKSARFFR